MVVELDPASGSSQCLLDGLDCAAGLALAPHADFLLVAERCGARRILKLWLAGPQVRAWHAKSAQLAIRPARSCQMHFRAMRTCTADLSWPST